MQTLQRGGGGSCPAFPDARGFPEPALEAALSRPAGPRAPAQQGLRNELSISKYSFTGSNASSPVICLGTTLNSKQGLPSLLPSGILISAVN